MPPDEVARKVPAVVADPDGIHHHGHPTISRFLSCKTSAHDRDHTDSLLRPD